MQSGQANKQHSIEHACSFEAWLMATSQVGSSVSHTHAYV
jgi:hypothetical protein